MRDHRTGQPELMPLVPAASLPAVAAAHPSASGSGCPFSFLAFGRLNLRTFDSHSYRSGLGEHLLDDQGRKRSGENWYETKKYI